MVYMPPPAAVTMPLARRFGLSCLGVLAKDFVATHTVRYFDRRCYRLQFAVFDHGFFIDSNKGGVLTHDVVREGRANDFVFYFLV